MDSLWSVWNDTTQPDTNRLNAMHKIAFDGYLFSKPDSAFYYASYEYEFAKSTGNEKWMGSACNTQGVSLTIRGNYVVHALYTFTQESYICFVMEYMHGGDLGAILTKETTLD